MSVISSLNNYFPISSAYPQVVSSLPQLLTSALPIALSVAQRSDKIPHLNFFQGLAVSILSNMATSIFRAIEYSSITGDPLFIDNKVDYLSASKSPTLLDLGPVEVPKNTALSTVYDSVNLSDLSKLSNLFSSTSVLDLRSLYETLSKLNQEGRLPPSFVKTIKILEVLSNLDSPIVRNQLGSDNQECQQALALFTDLTKTYLANFQIHQRLASNQIVFRSQLLKPYLLKSLQQDVGMTLAALKEDMVKKLDGVGAHALESIYKLSSALLYFFKDKKIIGDNDFNTLFRQLGQSTSQKTTLQQVISEITKSSKEHKKIVNEMLSKNTQSMTINPFSWKTVESALFALRISYFLNDQKQHNEKLNSLKENYSVN